MNDKNCGNCKFSMKRKPTDAALKCCRNPPVVDYESGEDRQPLVLPDEWCGEWQGEPAPLRIGDFVKCPGRYGHDAVFQIMGFTTSNNVDLRSLSMLCGGRLVAEPAELLRHEPLRIEFPK